MARFGASGWAISVRGFNSSLANKLLVLIDGREVYDALFSGVYWDIQDTPLQDIERIEVIRGPGASLWGANAVNGVINIITKKAGDTQGALTSVATGNQERALVTARFGGNMGSDAHWRVYGKYGDHAPQEIPPEVDAQDSWQSLRGGFRVPRCLRGRGNAARPGGMFRHELPPCAAAVSAGRRIPAICRAAARDRRCGPRSARTRCGRSRRTSRRQPGNRRGSARACG